MTIPPANKNARKVPFCASKRHLDLFSGIGGFTLAAQWTGWETIGFAEINPFASNVLKKHWPNIPNYGDVRNIPNDLGSIGLITGGFPCQPFSKTWKRRGNKDDRYIWPAMLDVIDRLKPSWVLGENVDGIVGVELNRVLADLEGKSYRVQPLIIPACAVEAKHKRNRVWIIAYAISNGLSENPSQKRAYNQRQFRCKHKISELLDDPEYRTEAIPGIHRSFNGIPEGLDENRLHSLGNAIVPQVAAVIMQSMMEVNETL